MRKTGRLIGGLLVVIYLLHHVSYNYFFHTHHFAWGTVTHSHPYLPADGGTGHTHTTAQCSLINYISSQLYLASKGIVVPLAICLLLFALCEYTVIAKPDPFYTYLKGRSPPVC